MSYFEVRARIKRGCLNTGSGAGRARVPREHRSGKEKILRAVMKALEPSGAFCRICLIIG